MQEFGILRELRIKAKHDLSAGRCMTTVEFEGLPRFEPNRLSYEIVGPDAPRQAPNGNFAITAALPTAMSLGRPLHLQGEADADFLAAMEEYMAAWCRWRPDLFRPVAISADSEVAPGLSSSTGAIMAFSGGLDSTFALHAHKRGLLGRRALDIEAAVLIQGFDIPLDDARALGIAREHVQAILDTYGVRLNIVRTNWQKPFCIKWAMTHVLGIAAVLHLFHRQFASAVIADDIAYEAQETPWSSNAITNQMLGCSAFPIRPTGAAWSRTEKASAVAGNPAVLQHLRVCYERPELGENCGVCEKCVRTKMNFRAVGVEPVPALGAPITIEDARRALAHAQQLDFLAATKDALEKGTWATTDPLRLELAELVQRFEPAPAKDKPTRARKLLKRVGKRIRPLLRVTRNALAVYRRAPTSPAAGWPKQQV
jgi:hypothetical protein